jgi:hypothetical protein
LAVLIDPFVIDPGLLDLYLTDARLNRPAWQVAVSDDHAVALVIPHASTKVQIFGDFVLNSLSQHLLCPLPEDVGQDVPAGR